MEKFTNHSIPEKIEFGSIKSKKVEANFNGGTITSDAGVLLLRQAEQKIGLLKRLSSCVKDTRHSSGDILDYTITATGSSTNFRENCLLGA